MKRKFSVSVRDGADDGEACVFIEEVVANDESGASAFLFVAGLRVERKRDEVALLRYVATHLPFLLADGRAEGFFAGLIAFWNTSYQFC